MFDLDELHELCLEYGLTQNMFHSFVIDVAKKFYKGRKNILFFDYDRGLFCFVKSNNKIGYFKPRKYDFFAFKKHLKTELLKKKAHTKNDTLAFQKTFFENLGGKNIKAFVQEIEDSGIHLSIKINEKKLEKFVVFVKFEDFFPFDEIEYGHNFWLYVKSVERKNNAFFLRATRKNASVIIAEFNDIVTFMCTKILSSSDGHMFSKDDFKYRFVDVNINRKELVVEYTNKNVSRFFGLVAKMLKQRIHFDLKWRFIDEKEQK